MSPETAKLIDRLDRQHTRAKNAEERLHRLRADLRVAMLQLRIGENEGVVRAKLEAKGVRV